MPRLRPRISLLTAILLTTIVGLSIVTYRLWVEVEPLRAQVRSMRTELGLLNVDDPNVPQAIRLASNASDSWRWRIFLPNDRRLLVYSGVIPPAAGVPLQDWLKSVERDGSGISTTCSAGEFVFDVGLEREGEQWNVATSRGNGSSTGRMSVDGDWLSQSSHRRISGSVAHDKATRFSPTEPILLMTLLEPVITRSGGSTTWKSPTGAANGVVVWIE